VPPPHFGFISKEAKGCLQETTGRESEVDGHETEPLLIGGEVGVRRKKRRTCCLSLTTSTP